MVWQWPRFGSLLPFFTYLYCSTACVTLTRSPDALSVGGKTQWSELEA